MATPRWTDEQAGGSGLPLAGIEPVVKAAQLVAFEAVLQHPNERYRKMILGLLVVLFPQHFKETKLSREENVGSEENSGEDGGKPSFASFRKYLRSMKTREQLQKLCANIRADYVEWLGQIYAQYDGGHELVIGAIEKKFESPGSLRTLITETINRAALAKACVSLKNEGIDLRREVLVCVANSRSGLTEQSTYRLNWGDRLSEQETERPRYAQYWPVYDYLAVHIRKRARMSDLLASKSSPEPVVEVTYRSQTLLKKKHTYQLRRGVTAAEFASALAEEHFKPTANQNIWYLCDKHNRPYAPELTVEELVRQHGSIAYLCRFEISPESTGWGAEGDHSVADVVDKMLMLEQSWVSKVLSCELRFFGCRLFQLPLIRHLFGFFLGTFGYGSFVMLNSRVWRCSERNIETVSCARIAKLMSGAPLLDSATADTIAWAYYRNGQYEEARPFAFKSLKKATRSDSACVRLYHQYYISRRLGDDTMAELILDWFRTGGGGDGLAKERVLADDDTLMWPGSKYYGNGPNLELTVILGNVIWFFVGFVVFVHLLYIGFRQVIHVVTKVFG